MQTYLLPIYTSFLGLPSSHRQGSASPVLRTPVHP